MGSICLDQERIEEAVDYFEQYLRKETSPRAGEMIREVRAVLEELKDEMKG